MTPKRHVKLYLRDSVPAVARTEQQTAQGRLQALQADGIVDGFTVESWPTRVTNGCAETVPALAAYEGFNSWAHSHDASMRPAFDRHECHSLYTGSTFTTTVLPVMCLAVYEDEKLVSVYPHARHGRPTTVSEGLAILESERQPPRQTPRRSERDKKKVRG